MASGPLRLPEWYPRNSYRLLLKFHIIQAKIQKWFLSAQCKMWKKPAYIPKRESALGRTILVPAIVPLPSKWIIESLQAPSTHTFKAKIWPSFQSRGPKMGCIQCFHTMVFSSVSRVSNRIVWTLPWRETQSPSILPIEHRLSSQTTVPRGQNMTRWLSTFLFQISGCKSSGGRRR